MLLEIPLCREFESQCGKQKLFAFHIQGYLCENYMYIKKIESCTVKNCISSNDVIFLFSNCQNFFANYCKKKYINVEAHTRFATEIDNLKPFFLFAL